MKRPYRFTKSKRLWTAAKKLIAGGSQGTRTPEFDESPVYFTRAKGCRMWDVDGNEFIDLLCSIGPVILGYAYPRVDQAARKVMKDSFQSSMNHPNQLELAKLLIEYIPCAERVRFLKTGTEDIRELPDSMFKHGECDRILHMYAQEVSKHGEDAVIATLASNMKIMAREAAKHDICLAFENMGDMMPIGSFDTLGKLVAAIDEPNAGYCLDSGHAWMRGENPVDWVRFMGKKLFETHFHDNRGGSKAVEALHGDDEHLPPGFGTIDWRKVIQALDEVGFPGPVTFESDGWQLPDRAEGFRHAMRYWRFCEQMALRK